MHWLIAITTALASMLAIFDTGSGGGSDSAGSVGLADIMGQGELLQDPGAGTGEVAGDQGASEDQGAGEAGEGEGEAQLVEGEGEAGDGEAGELEHEETELDIDDAERDYSDEVYSRYANHFSKQWNQQIDPTNPLHRAALKEIIERGENQRRTLAELDAAREASESGEEEGVEEQQFEQVDEGVQDTPEQVQAFLQQVDNFAASRVRPEVAKKFATDFMIALWGSKGGELAKKMAPEQANNFTKVLTSFGYLFLNDALPQILDNYIPGLIGRQYPGFDQVHQDAINEAAFEALATKTDRAGNAVYPDLEDLVFGDGSDLLGAVYEQNPWLRTHKFADGNGRLLPPVEQAQRRLEVAIGMARGQAPPAELMRGTAEAVRRQERRQARVASNGRLAPGEGGGSFDRQGDDADQLLKGMANFGDRDRQIQDMLAPKP